MSEGKIHHVQHLWDELLLHTLLLSLGSLSLSMLMSRSIFNVLDWRPIAITVSSDIIAIGIDHYFDHAGSFVHAKKTGDVAALSVFKRARLMLIASAVVLSVALVCSPPLTWVMVTIFFGPAFIWDVNLLDIFSPSRDPDLLRQKDEARKQNIVKKKLSVKRIPGMKSLLVGIIRGGGTFAVVYSVLEPITGSVGGHSQMWTAKQIVIWSIVNRACHAVMADVRDFPEDKEKRIPTIPVLLDSVWKTKTLVTALHTLVCLAYHNNPYIIFASLYATALVWVLNTGTPRRTFHFSFQSQTLVGLMYFLAQLAS
ncbi:hypothetical protein CERSUDRAFT_127520 [Gelatoporia subvermispora B]|uniref:UbiA prenyltransferase family n=1 Tax=Ceriporiopsis subvermispora (strain B) TaxID=914234 RepID=M2Q342_CERS8|nr:hypothetical protein CERSUDRAFT_127520 [Gelatoporia subvermispora B]